MTLENLLTDFIFVLQISGNFCVLCCKIVPENMIRTMNAQMLERARCMKKFQGCSLGIGAPICTAHFETPNETIVDIAAPNDVIEDEEFDQMRWLEPSKKKKKKLAESDDKQHDTNSENRPLYTSEEDEDGAHSRDHLHI
jgi:hypothetical protein